ncbi:MAG: GNAT family N-acetyltransferase [Vicinamibacterales bacterium]|jgi:ribosomal protein S18 acetylase RimI-like enzyme|nr:GNAT family N-acetyltransferase [Vicinamibacterales bacterium]
MFTIRRLDAALEPALIAFFRLLHEGGVEQFFHPHPFTADEARARAGYGGEDLYYVVTEGDQILGYGFLRGWDEGYDIPSLGIVIHPARRGVGLGRTLMHALHRAARERGALRVRLKVYSKNVAARRLYEDLGYLFGPVEEDQQVGFLDL